MNMSENSEIVKPKINYVTVEIRKRNIDEKGHIYEVVEEQEIPDFLLDSLIEGES